MLVLLRFRVPPGPDGSFADEVSAAWQLLASKPGYVGGQLGRAADDPDLWVFATRWTGAGAYRRALSAYDVKVAAWPVRGRALDEPNAFEVVADGPLP